MEDFTREQIRDIMGMPVSPRMEREFNKGSRESRQHNENAELAEADPDTIQDAVVIDVDPVDAEIETDNDASDSLPIPVPGDMGIELLFVNEPFGLTTENNPERNRRIDLLDDIDGLVSLVASHQRGLKRKLTKAKKSGGSVNLPVIEHGRHRHFALSAHYDGDGRSYVLERVDDDARGNEGFEIMSSHDDGVIVNRLEQAGDYVETMSQDELFDEARAVMEQLSKRFYSVDLDVASSIAPVKRTFDMPSVRIPRITAGDVLGGWIKGMIFVSDNLMIRPFNTQRKRKIAAATMFMHLLIPGQNEDFIMFDAIPAPWPAELMYDSVHYEEHRATAYAEPQTEILGSEEDSMIAIEYYDHPEDLSAVDSLLYSRKLSNYVRDVFDDQGLWYVDLGEAAQKSGSYESSCMRIVSTEDSTKEDDPLHDSFTKYDVTAFVDDPTLAEEGLTLAYEQQNVLRICTEDGSLLPDGRVYLYKDDK